MKNTVKIKIGGAITTKRMDKLSDLVVGGLRIGKTDFKSRVNKRSKDCLLEFTMRDFMDGRVCEILWTLQQWGNPYLCVTRDNLGEERTECFATWGKVRYRSLRGRPMMYSNEIQDALNNEDLEIHLDLIAHSQGPIDPFRIVNSARERLAYQANLTSVSNA